MTRVDGWLSDEMECMNRPIHASFESAKKLPPNVTQLVRVGSNWFALTRQGKKVNVRLVRRGG